MVSVLCLLGMGLGFLRILGKRVICLLWWEGFFVRGLGFVVVV